MIKIIQFGVPSLAVLVLLTVLGGGLVYSRSSGVSSSDFLFADFLFDNQKVISSLEVMGSFQHYLSQNHGEFDSDDWTVFGVEKPIQTKTHQFMQYEKEGVYYGFAIAKDASQHQHFVVAVFPPEISQQLEPSIRYVICKTHLDDDDAFMPLPIYDGGNTTVRCAPNTQRVSMR